MYDLTSQHSVNLTTDRRGRRAFPALGAGNDPDWCVRKEGLVEVITLVTLVRIPLVFGTRREEFGRQVGFPRCGGCAMCYAERRAVSNVRKRVHTNMCPIL